jgi:hypothetical protein
MELAAPREEGRDLLGRERVGLLVDVRVVLAHVEALDAFGRDVRQRELSLRRLHHDLEDREPAVRRRRLVITGRNELGDPSLPRIDVRHVELVEVVVTGPLDEEAGLLAGRPRDEVFEDVRPLPPSLRAADVQ